MVDEHTEPEAHLCCAKVVETRNTVLMVRSHKGQLWIGVNGVNSR